MKVAVIGSGGREHALLRALHDSGSNPECYVYPGNDGMMDVGNVLDCSNKEDIVSSMSDEGIDLCVIGPESYLEEGLADDCKQAGIPCWGPNQEAAQLETSKLYAKRFMNRHGIPTGDYQVAESPEEVWESIDEFPVVLKYDALAGGKGVTVCFSDDDVEGYIEEVFEDRRFGTVEPVLVEEHLDGTELTVICAVRDGEYQMFPPSRDYKPLRNDDEGPNTGGMGSVSSTEMISSEKLDQIEEDVIQPTMAGLRSDDLSYRGFLYFGLMLTEEGPKILEYNCRFGDPEAQATLPLLEGDFAGYLMDAHLGELNSDYIHFRDDWSVCVMAASENYPYEYSHGQVIRGLEDVRNARVYHSGTRRNSEGMFEVDGGRILGVVAIESEREAARERAYDGIEKIDFDGMHYRNDIGRLHFDDKGIQVT